MLQKTALYMLHRHRPGFLTLVLNALGSAHFPGTGTDQRVDVAGERSPAGGRLRGARRLVLQLHGRSEGWTPETSTSIFFLEVTFFILYDLSVSFLHPL